MSKLHILITGGCGFVGSNLARALLADGHAVTCFDNLMRRGSEILLGDVQAAGARFVHGDIRNPEDFRKLDTPMDVMIECSAEPSVLVGTTGADALFMMRNNLWGAVHCFEWAREQAVPILFLSTSRVYPYETINALEYKEMETRYELAAPAPGASDAGIAETFPIHRSRSLYGATKLCAELLLMEYAALYDLPCVINRCGVIAGPRQLGKVDQGIFTFWLLQHHFGDPLRYIGFGGRGKQVRDVLHIEDLIDLVRLQLPTLSTCRAEVYNVGGGRHSNLSLLEATQACRDITGNRVPVAETDEERPADVIWYLTDHTEVSRQFDWTPKRSAIDVLRDTYAWMQEADALLRTLQS